jgi:alcohol dehydrogenase (cytochrome c)
MLDKGLVIMGNRWLFGLLLLLLISTELMAQSADDLKRDAQTPEDVVTFGMGHGLQRYSSLTEINTETVENLVPAWTFSLQDHNGQEAQPLVYDGLIYATTYRTTYAVDARTGRRVWKHDLDIPTGSLPMACCGIVIRGAALFEGRLYRQTLDNYVIALDAKTGKEIWRQHAAKFEDEYSMTGAPVVANGVVITGVAGADYGARGFLDGWDAASGEHLWRLNSIPAPDEPGGDTWEGDADKAGGGSTWLTGSYDPELDLVFWGIGNPAPWSAAKRHGDNLYTNSVIAVRPKTGERVWYYQTTPNDTFDYDGVNELIHATLNIDGIDRKVLMQANRNGYFYLLDRKSGELLRASQFVDKLTWADGVDLKTGRPIVSALTKRMLRDGDEIVVWPSNLGGKNVAPASYSTDTGLVYLNGIELSMRLKPADAEDIHGTFYIGLDWGHVVPKDGTKVGRLRAVDPLTGRRVWEVAMDPFANGGTLVTAGMLVFTGLQTGELAAYHAATGEQLWRYQTGSGIIAPPITYTLDGAQYVAVLSGTGGIGPRFVPQKGFMTMNKGGLLTVFKLFRSYGE